MDAVNFARRVIGAAARNVRSNSNRIAAGLADSATRKRTLHMLGAHAAAGAVVGGATEGMRGRSVVRGAMIGGALGGALGMSGGVSSMHAAATMGLNRLGTRAGMPSSMMHRMMGGSSRLFNRASGSRYGYLGGY